MSSYAVYLSSLPRIVSTLAARWFDANFATNVSLPSVILSFECCDQLFHGEACCRHHLLRRYCLVTSQHEPSQAISAQAVLDLESFALKFLRDDFGSFIGWHI